MESVVLPAHQPHVCIDIRDDKQEGMADMMNTGEFSHSCSTSDSSCSSSPCPSAQPLPVPPPVQVSVDDFCIQLALRNLPPCVVPMRSQSWGNLPPLCIENVSTAEEPKHRSPTPTVDSFGLDYLFEEPAEIVALPAPAAAASSSLPPPSVKTVVDFGPVVSHTHFTCGICLCEESHLNGVSITPKLRRKPGQIARAPPPDACTHIFCKDCVSAYLEHEITDGQVLKIRCPGQVCPPKAPQYPCTRVLSTDLIKDNTTPEMFEKYQRFLRLKSDDGYRQCPNRACLHVQQKKALGGSEMTCEKCDTRYCFKHDLAHAQDLSDAGCKAYAKKLKLDSVKSLGVIEEETVKCPWPGCPAKIMKESGCNHLSCSMCNTDFCYLCRGFYFGGLHFVGINLFGCPGMQNYDGKAGCRDQWWRHWLRYLFGLPTFLTLFGLLLTVVSTILLVWLATLVIAAPIAMPVYCVINRRVMAFNLKTISLPNGEARVQHNSKFWKMSSRRERLREAIFWGPKLIKWIWQL